MISPNSYWYWDKNVILFKFLELSCVIINILFTSIWPNPYLPDNMQVQFIYKVRHLKLLYFRFGKAEHRHRSYCTYNVIFCTQLQKVHYDFYSTFGGNFSVFILLGFWCHNIYLANADKECFNWCRYLMEKQDLQTMLTIIRSFVADRTYF